MDVPYKIGRGRGQQCGDQGGALWHPCRGDRDDRSADDHPDGKRGDQHHLAAGGELLVGEQVHAVAVGQIDVSDHQIDRLARHDLVGPLDGRGRRCGRTGQEARQSRGGVAVVGRDGSGVVWLGGAGRGGRAERDCEHCETTHDGSSVPQRDAMARGGRGLEPRPTLRSEPPRVQWGRTVKLQRGGGSSHPARLPPAPPAKLRAAGVDRAPVGSGLNRYNSMA